MTPRTDDDSLRRLLNPPPPPGLTERTIRAVRERNARGDLALRFDIAASSSGVARLRPGTGKTAADSLRARSLAGQAREELAEYLRGLRSFFTVPVDLSAVAPFQRSVLDATATIPFGEVRSYRWIAARIGSAKAVRAVGAALGHNPVSIVVPCHRVLRTDGSLGGYALGLELKTRLLGLERETPTLVGTDTTRIVCRHGCSDERRFSERHRVVFSSLREARAAGYRACRRCHPRDV